MKNYFTGFEWNGIACFCKLNRQLFSFILMAALFAAVTASCNNEKEDLTYLVSFDSTGGTPTPQQQTVKEGGKVDKPADPVRENYNFAGWAKANNETSALWNFETETVTENMTLFARWSIIEHLVTFDSDGGSAVSSQSIAHGGRATKPADPTREGYAFDGWFNGETAWDFATSITAPITLKAKWTAVHIVTFDSGGGTSVSPQTVRNGATATKPEDPTRSGYMFDGWFNGETEWNFSTAITAPITLTAKWTVAHIVTFNSDGGSAVTSQTVRNGSTATKPTDPTKENFTFVEWRKEGESTAFDFNTPITAPITLKAVWYDPNTVYVTDTSEGVVLSGATLAAKLNWIDRSAESHNTYIVDVSANENIAPTTLQYTGAINITVILRSDGANRIIRLSTNGTMFTVRSNVTFILDNNITLQGHAQNTGRMVYVNGGIFKMNNGSTITGNTGGGVEVSSGCLFEMYGGTISGNSANDGGGVYVSGTFTMFDGTISDNTASNAGGVGVRGIFTMNNGTISNNTANNSGGGVGSTGSFYMNGGIISGNTASEYGGGVVLDYSTFTKLGGTITGYNSDPNNGNVVRDGSGVLARRGHAVYYSGTFISSTKRKETTAGPEVNLDGNNMVNWDE